ncbi:MAG: PA4642 family protein [Pseudohongiellaceae bacterium]
MTDEKKKGSERTQKATRNEDWSDERLKTFFELLPPEGMPADYNILLKAYRGMTAELFARFVPLFIEADHDINAALDDGTTMLDQIASHRKSTAYAEVLKSAGAKGKTV